MSQPFWPSEPLEEISEEELERREKNARHMERAREFLRVRREEAEAEAAAVTELAQARELGSRRRPKRKRSTSNQQNIQRRAEASTAGVATSSSSTLRSQAKSLPLRADVESNSSKSSTRRSGRLAAGSTTPPEPFTIDSNATSIGSVSVADPRKSSHSRKSSVSSTSTRVARSEASEITVMVDEERQQNEKGKGKGRSAPHIGGTMPVIVEEKAVSVSAEVPTANAAAVARDGAKSDAQDTELQAKTQTTRAERRKTVAPYPVERNRQVEAGRKLRSATNDKTSEKDERK